MRLYGNTCKPKRVDIRLVRSLWLQLWKYLICLRRKSAQKTTTQFQSLAMQLTAYNKIGHVYLEELAELIVLAELFHGVPHDALDVVVGRFIPINLQANTANLNGL